MGCERNHRWDCQCEICTETRRFDAESAPTRGVDWKTGHVYQLAADGSGEVHDDECPHPDHYRMTDAEVRRHGAEQLRKDWDALMSDFCGDTEAQAIEGVAPKPETWYRCVLCGAPTENIPAYCDGCQSGHNPIPATLTPDLSADEIVAESGEKEPT